ncbi:MAG: endolytic transglycosylase MltG [Prolixibacteraceae bacterium]|nr:endolytic transglycosylase MltG [Prolixibacteraceae bacterium]
MVIERRNKRNYMPRIARFSMVIFALLLIILGFRAFELYGYIFKPNVAKDHTLVIVTGETFEDVYNKLEKEQVLINLKAFKWIAKKKDYKKNIRPGLYKLKKGTNTNNLVNLLRAGDQHPVELKFHNVGSFADLAGKVSAYIEADSVDLMKQFTNVSVQEKFGFTPETFPAMFIPNTYEFYWTTTPEQFISRMNAEYKSFWSEERLNKAEAKSLTPVEVVTLASIIEKETIIKEELPIVAGLYINRLKRGMALQADPTIKFVLKDSSIRRITNDMLKIDSPYNTYKYSGLPPGPIGFPEISTIDAVLNATEHSYLFMCAKEDFSGEHRFATNLAQHNANAARYRDALNKNNIWR